MTRAGAAEWQSTRCRVEAVEIGQKGGAEMNRLRGRSERRTPRSAHREKVVRSVERPGSSSARGSFATSNPVERAPRESRSEREGPWSADAADRVERGTRRQPPDRSSLRAYSAARGR